MKTGISSVQVLLYPCEHASNAGGQASESETNLGAGRSRLRILFTVEQGTAALQAAAVNNSCPLPAATSHDLQYCVCHAPACC